MDNLSFENLDFKFSNSSSLEFLNVESRFKNFKSIFMLSIEILNGLSEQAKNKDNKIIIIENI
jgi:hypothetical protein